MLCSRKLSPAEENYVSNHELLAVKLVLEELCHWALLTPYILRYFGILDIVFELWSSCMEILYGEAESHSKPRIWAAPTG